MHILAIRVFNMNAGDKLRSINKTTQQKLLKRRSEMTGGFI